MHCVRRTVTFLWLNTLDSQQNAVSVGEQSLVTSVLLLLLLLLCSTLPNCISMLDPCMLPLTDIVLIPYNFVQRANNAPTYATVLQCR
jgi:hypothetical protein